MQHIGMFTFEIIVDRIYKMKNYMKTMARKEYLDLMIRGKVEPNPIGQRPQVPGQIKSQKIVEASFNGFFMGALILRDISKDENAQLSYPGIKYLVIDGGHRSRAYLGYYSNKFLANNELFKTLDEREQEQWLTQQETLCIYECTALEATQIFRNINKTTPVNNIEMLMAHEVSPFAKVIRSQTKKYFEYQHEGQQSHRLFNLKLNNKDEKIPECFTKTSINPRRKWDEWVAFAFGMIVTGGVIDYTILNDLTDDLDFEPSTAQLKSLKHFLDLAYECKPQNGYNDIKLASFLMVYFNLKGKIIDRSKFATELWRAHSCVTGNTSTYFSEEQKKEYRTMLNNYFDGEGMRKVAQAIINEMDIENAVNLAPRSILKSKKVELLELQRGVCAIDGEPLDIDDAEYGHDIAYSHGGTDGAIIRKKHNRAMGQMSIDQYKKIYTTH